MSTQKSGSSLVGVRGSTPTKNIAWFRLGLRLVSLLLILAAAGLVYREWGRFLQARGRLPAGSLVAGVPVGGLEYSEAARRVEAAYSLPVELRYEGETIPLSTEAAGFQLDLDQMLPAAEAQDRRSAWPAFKDYLQGIPQPALDVPLQYTLDRNRLRSALEDIAARYDQPAVPARPVPASFQWEPGQTGKELDIEAALPLIEKALPLLENRRVALPVNPVDPARPSLENLEVQLRQILATAGYNSLIDLYFYDLETGEQFQFARRGGEELHLPPDIAFSASSIIKIPILLSAFRRLDGPPDATVDGWLSAMFAASSNEAADAAMHYLIDEIRGPLVVTEDLQELGFENTFLAGFFAPGSPLLQIYSTPANERPGVDTHADLYNQATPADIGRLLADIYTCAQSGSGPILETFPEEFTREKCQLMLEYMKQDREPYMLKAALPEATPAARKHGYYGSSAGVIQTISDAGILFTPGGDYVLAIFLNDPDLLLFDPANDLMARLSLAVYNYFNLPTE